MAGLTKFCGVGEAAKTCSFANYVSGAQKIVETFEKGTFLPHALLTPYAFSLAWLEILIGLAILVGFKTRISLASLGLLVISIAFGHMLMQTPGVVTDIGLYLVLIAMALMLSCSEKWALCKDCSAVCDSTV